MDQIRIFAQKCIVLMGIQPKDYSDCLIWAGGEMALLTGKCNNNIIKLLGQWRSDAMMEYLNTKSLPVIKRLALLMYNNGWHSFLPSEVVPINDNQLFLFFFSRLHFIPTAFLLLMTMEVTLVLGMAESKLVWDQIWIKPALGLNENKFNKHC